MRHMFQSSFSASYKRHPLVGGTVDPYPYDMPYEEVESIFKSKLNQSEP
ncbi:hypothetical protein NUACC26_064880 [Scytonema sp. NUACC26]